MLSIKNIEEIMSKNLIEIFKKHDCVLAGGTIRSIYCQTLTYDKDYSNEDKISDFDIYFKNSNSYNSLIKELKNLDYIVLCESLNATTLGKKDKQKNIIPIQLIKLDFTIGTPEEIINNFDFSICSACYDFKNEQFYLNENFEKDNQIRKLRYNIKGKFPLASLIRLNKYVIKKKYKISNVELLKIALCINNLNLNSYKELKEQLNGIDTLLLKPLTDNLIENEKYDIEEFMDSMENYLSKALNKE